MSDDKHISSENGLNVLYDAELPGDHCVYHGSFNGEHVVVKQIMPKTSNIDDVKSKLKRLINVGYHPNIAALKKVVHTREPPCILVALEPCGYESLRSLMKGNKPIDPQDHKVIFRHMLEGLKFLHEKKIFHRTISPQHVIFSKCGKMAKLCGLANKNVLTDKARDLKGTTQFTSPEYTKQPPEPLTEKSDVYSAAMVMFFVATNGESISRKLRAFGGASALGNEEEQTGTAPVESSLAQRLDSKYPNQTSFIYLLKQMLVTEPSERPTVHDILLSSYFWDEDKIESCDGQVLQAFKDWEDISNEVARGNFEEFYAQTRIDLDETSPGFIDFKLLSSDKERCMLFHDLYLFFGNRFKDAPYGLVPADYDDVLSDMESMSLEDRRIEPKTLAYSANTLQSEEFIIEGCPQPLTMKETETEQRKEALTFQGIHKGYIEEDIFFKLIPLTDEGREAAKTLWKMRGDDNWVGLKRNVIVDVPEDEENTICQPGRYVCIAMEKCIQPLTDYWKVKSVSYDEILIKLRSILTALEFIHGKSIVHNAITMRKLLLTDGEQLKICPSRKSRKFGPGDDEGLLDMAKLYDLLNYEFTKYIQPPSKETSEKVLFDNLCQHLSSYSATRALYHPFLWSAEKKLLFLKLAGDEFDHRENNEANAKLEAELKRAFTGSWADKMRLSSDEQQKWFTVPDILRDRKDVTDMLYAKSVQPKNPNAGKKRPETEKVKKYDEKSGIELLRFIRNVYSHWEGDISKMERVFQLESQTLFKCEKDVWNFFSWRFPKLLLALYDFILTEDVEDVRKGLVKKGFLPLMVEK